MAQQDAAPITETSTSDENRQVFDAAPTTASHKRIYLAIKRSFDVVVALAGILFLFPFFLLVAAVIRLDSPGGVLHRQTRVGKNGRPFPCYKFRSMYVDAEERKARLEHLNERNGPIFKIKNDPRITRMGRYLRKYSIDEAPQILNVLRGEMSLIGPRPPLPDEVAGYLPHHRRRLEVTPGITGLWQVTARDSPDFEEWVRLDVEYIERQGLWLDLLILLKTPLAVISAKGAS